MSFFVRSGRAGQICYRFNDIACVNCRAYTEVTHIASRGMLTMLPHCGTVVVACLAKLIVWLSARVRFGGHQVSLSVPNDWFGFRRIFGVVYCVYRQ